LNRLGNIPEFSDLTRPAAAAEAEGVGFQEMMLTLRRWRFFILALVVLGAAGAGVTYFFLPAKYSSSSTVVLLANRDTLSETDPSASMDNTAVQSEIAIIESAAVAQLVVERLKLQDDPTWNGEAGRETAKTPPAPEDIRRDIAIYQINQATQARRIDNSYAIEVRVQASTADAAARLANERVAAYLDWHSRANADSTKDAAGWLDERVPVLKAEVEQKERMVSEYRARQGLLAAEGSTIAEQQLSSARTAVAEAEGHFNETSSRLKQVEDLRAAGGSVDTSAAALDSQLIQSLRVQEAEAQRRLATLSNYTDMHPDVQNVKAEIRDIRAAIDQELGRILINLTNEVTVARNRVESTRAALASAERRLGQNNAGLVRLNELEREAAASRKSYEDHLSLQQQTQDRSSKAPAVARRLSPAVPPLSPDRPSLSLMLVFGAAAGLLVALVIMFTRRLLDDRLHGASDAMRKVGRRALVSIPNIRPESLRSLPKTERNPAGYAIMKPFSAFSETYRVLRKSLYPGETMRRNVVVAITSALPDEGKTTTAWSLARVSALSGQRVIIVDCDFRRRSLSGALTARPKVGVSTVIADYGKLPEAVQLDERTGASLIPAVVDDLVVQDLLGSEKMAEFVDKLRKSYDLVVLDCPPVLAVADAIAAAALADSTIVVSRANRTPAKAIQSAIHQIEAAGGFVAGLALNRVQVGVIGKYSFDDTLYVQAARGRYYVE
jgi:capsular exopolysaccharide synthesis family protein